jgi:hypothetical protein
MAISNLGKIGIHDFFPQDFMHILYSDSHVGPVHASALLIAAHFAAWLLCLRHVADCIETSKRQQSYRKASHDQFSPRLKKEGASPIGIDAFGFDIARRS